MTRTQSIIVLAALVLIALAFTSLISGVNTVFMDSTNGMITDRLAEGSFRMSDLWYAFTQLPQLLMDLPKLLRNVFGSTPSAPIFWFYPAFFTSVWLLLYSGSIFLLKGLRRFDRAFKRFGNFFNIEKRPHHAIGVIAGAILAIGYWCGAIIVSLI